MKKKINKFNKYKSIALVANSSWYLYNFRRELILSLKDQGYRVYIISPLDEYSKYLIDISYKKINWKLNRGSINIFNEISSIFDLIKKVREINPLLIHNFTMKGCIYGTFAAFLSCNPIIINSITGLGHLFLSNSFFIKIIKLFIIPIIKVIFYLTDSKFILQNFDDQNLLINKGITNKKDSIVIKSSGVNIDFFKPEKKENNDQFIILFPSRIIKEKGFIELEMACESLWDKGYKLKLYIAGYIDIGNRSSLTKEEFSNLMNNPNIKCLGHVKNIKEIYKKVDLVVLPSWREGLSRTLLEASAMEKPIITTNVPGCRDVITHNYNGLLVNLKDYKDIERNIIYLYKNKDIATKFGKRARERVIKNFDLNIINSQTINLYHKLISQREGQN